MPSAAGRSAAFAASPTIAPSLEWPAPSLRSGSVYSKPANVPSQNSSANFRGPRRARASEIPRLWRTFYSGHGLLMVPNLRFGTASPAAVNLRRWEAVGGGSARGAAGAEVLHLARQEKVLRLADG